MNVHVNNDESMNLLKLGNNGRKLQSKSENKENFIVKRVQFILLFERHLFIMCNRIHDISIHKFCGRYRCLAAVFTFLSARLFIPPFQIINQNRYLFFFIRNKVESSFSFLHHFCLFHNSTENETDK